MHVTQGAFDQFKMGTRQTPLSTKSIRAPRLKNMDAGREAITKSFYGSDVSAGNAARAGGGGGKAEQAGAFGTLMEEDDSNRDPSPGLGCLPLGSGQDQERGAQLLARRRASARKKHEQQKEEVSGNTDALAKRRTLVAH